MILYIILFLFSFLIIWTIRTYNRLVKNRNKMAEAWSIIDVFLKKRYEIIPVLVNVVSGYVSYENKLLETLIYSRAQALQATDVKDRMKYENLVSQTTGRLLLHIEKYPELKASVHFLRLQKQLSDIENELEKARRYFNGTVRINNIGLETFPVNLIGKLFHLPKGVYFVSNKTEIR